MPRVKKVLTAEEMKARKERYRLARYKRSEERAAQRKMLNAEKKAKREQTIKAKREARAAEKAHSKALKESERTNNLNGHLEHYSRIMQVNYNKIKEAIDENEPCDILPKAKGVCYLFKKGAKLIDSYNKGRPIRPVVASNEPKAPRKSKMVKGKAKLSTLAESRNARIAARKAAVQARAMSNLSSARSVRAAGAKNRALG